MVSLNPFVKKEERPKDLKTQLSELGIDFRTDDFFKASLDNIEANAQIFTDEAIDAMKLSLLRTNLMKQNSKMIAYLMHHAPHAKAIENRRFGEAVEAAIDLLHEDYRRILSKSTDEAVLAEVTEDWSQINILVTYSFGTPRVSVNKSVVVQILNKQDTRYEGGEEEV